MATTSTIVGGFLVGDGHLVGGLGVLPTGGVPTAQQFGTVTFVAGSFAQTKTVVGLGSAQSFGTITLRGAISRTVVGVNSAQSFGSLAFRVTVHNGGLLTAQAFGAPFIQVKPATQFVQIPGLGEPVPVITILNRFLVGDGTRVGQTGGLFGVPTVFVNQIVTGVGGLGSAQRFGVVTIHTAITRVVGGVGSVAALGTVVIKTWIGVPVGGVGSAQSFGIFHLMYPQWIPLGGVPSTALVGQPFVFKVWLYSFDCVHVDLDPNECLPEELLPSLVEDLDLVVAAQQDFTLTPVDEESLDLQPVGCD